MKLNKRAAPVWEDENRKGIMSEKTILFLYTQMEGWESMKRFA
jgi:hypothetical protein